LDGTCITFLVAACVQLLLISFRHRYRATRDSAAVYLLAIATMRTGSSKIISGYISRIAEEMPNLLYAMHAAKNTLTNRSGNAG